MAWRLSWRRRSPGTGSGPLHAPDACPERGSSAVGAANSEERPGSGGPDQARTDAGHELEHRWLATRPPPRRGLRPRSVAQGHVARAVEHRRAALLPVCLCPLDMPSVIICWWWSRLCGKRAPLSVLAAVGRTSLLAVSRGCAEAVCVFCRYMAVTAFAGVDDGVCSEGAQRISIVAASSEALLQLLQLDTESKRQGCLK